MDELKGTTFSWLYSNFITFKKVATPPNTNQLVTKSALITNYYVNETKLKGVANNQIVRRNLVEGINVSSHLISLSNPYDPLALENPFVVEGLIKDDGLVNGGKGETTQLGNIFLFSNLIGGGESITLKNLKLKSGDGTIYNLDINEVLLNNTSYLHTNASSSFAVNILFIVTQGSLVICFSWDTAKYQWFDHECSFSFSNNVNNINSVTAAQYQHTNFTTTIIYTNMSSQFKNSISMVLGLSGQSTLGTGMISKL